MKCTSCGSGNTRYRENRNNYICDDCDHVFEAEMQQKVLHIFISYGHDEYIPFAQRVMTELEKRGHEVWFDSERLKPGCDWEQYIEDGLTWVAQSPSSGRILLIMTPHSVRRPDGYCLNEIAMALDKRVPIIPVMLVFTTPPLSIYRLQWLDVSTATVSGQIDEVSFQSHFPLICQALEHDMMDKTGSMSRLWSALSPLDFSADIRFHQAWFTGRRWVFKEVENWLRSESGDRMFWISGPPGIGKSAISVKLIQSCPNIAAFHLCIRGHSEKSSPKRLICTLAYQLSTQLPEYRERLLSLDIPRELERCNDRALFDVLVVQPLTHDVIVPSQPIVILIDALDEASVNGRNSIASFIAAEFTRLPGWLRFIVTSRPMPELQSTLQAFSPRLLGSKDARNINDLRQYICTRLASMEVDEAFALAVEKILSNADGIFLYAKFVCEEIMGRRLALSAYNAFPRDLGAVYQRFFEEAFENIQVYRTHTRPILELLTISPNPLSKAEAAQILEVNIDEINDFLIQMGAFFSLDANGYITAFHSSIFDWLVDDEKAGLFSIDITRNKAMLFTRLWALFKDAGYDFFYSGPLKKVLLRELPTLIEIGRPEINTDQFVQAYLSEADRKLTGKGNGKAGVMLELFLVHKQHAEFILALFSALFRLDRSYIMEFVPDEDRVGMQKNIHYDGLVVLNRHVNGLEYRKQVDYNPASRKYWYFLDVLLPELYLPTTDIVQIFEAIESGIASAIDDGRLSAISSLLTLYADALALYYDRSPDLVAQRTDALAEQIRDDDFANYYMAISKGIPNKVASLVDTFRKND